MYTRCLSTDPTKVEAMGLCTNHVDKILGNFDPPSPLCGHFYLIAVIKCCGHLSNPPSPLICPRGL